LETSLYLYLAEEDVRQDKIKSATISFNDEDNPFNWVDLFGAGVGPGTLISWTSSYSETGVLGDAEKRTKQKGEQAYGDAVVQLRAFVEDFRSRPIDVRHKEQRPGLTMPLPWGQRDTV
jgi:creatinine amidohydrolase